MNFFQHTTKKNEAERIPSVKMQGEGSSAKTTAKATAIWGRNFSLLALLVSFFLGALSTWAADMDISTVADPVTKTYPRTSGNGDNYTNSDTGTTYTLLFQTNMKDAGTQSGSISGDIQVVMDLGYDVTNTQYNYNRLRLSNTNNTFTGGLVIQKGTLHGYNGSVLGASTGTITIDEGVLMSGLAINELQSDMEITQKIALTSGSWGGLRASRNIKVSGQVTGEGDLVIVTDGGIVTLTNTNNNYGGVTSVGTVQGGSNMAAYLTLGADNVLPSTTILEIGKSQNSTYNYTSTSAEVRLGGFTNTVAGLYGVGSVHGAGTLNINVANGETYTFSGSFSRKASTVNYPNVVIGGAGTQIFAGTAAMSLNSLTVNNSQLGIDRAVTDTITTNALTLANGTIDLQGSLTVTGSLSVSGTSKISNTSDTTGVFTRSGWSTDGGTFSATVLEGNIRLVLSGNTGVRAVLAPNQKFTGGITITNMVVRPALVTDTTNFLGACPTTYDADAILLDGGTIQNNGATTTASTGNSITIEANRGITVTANGGSIRMGHTGTPTATIDSVITGEGWFGVTPDQGHAVILNAVNTYKGETRIGTSLNMASGNPTLATLSMGVANALPTTSDIVFGTTSSNLRLYGFNQSVGALVSREYGVETNVPGAVADMGLISSTASATLTIGNANATGTYTDGNFTGSIQNTGTGTASTNAITLVKVGTGTQILGGTLENTRTDLTVEGGAVELAKSTANYAVRNLTLTAGEVKLTGDGGNQIDGYAVMSSGTKLDLNGKSETLTYLQGSGTVQNSGAERSVLTLSNALSTADVTFEGTLTGNIQIVKDGAGRQRFTGANTYSGGTLIKEGVFYAGGGSVGSGTIEMEGGTLMCNNSTTYANAIVLAEGKTGNFRAGAGDSGTTLTFTGVISGDGTLTFNYGEGNGGKFVLSGENTYSGGTQLLGAGASNTYSVTVGSNTAFGTGTITVNPNANQTVKILWDATSETRTLANDIEIQNNRSLELTRTGDNEAIYTGLISGTGNLKAEGLIFEYDLADLTDTTFWDLTGNAALEGATLRILADSPTDYIGQTFRLFGENTTATLTDMILDFSGAGGNIWNYGIENGQVWFQVNTAAVPEPSTWCLLLFGGMLVWQFQKRRNA
ncbi:MAG: autotransporter-associated beta strand repeat-containing protein [Planctomycetia bacterium]|nr:autotransporter-associated beta strand repeat-containing protein [Planctomycetia bacterium]